MDLLLPILMTVCGLLTHYLKQIATAHRSGSKVSFIDYWVGSWPESSIALVGSVAGFVAMLELGSVSGLNAFALGFMANSLADIVGGRAQKIVG